MKYLLILLSICTLITNCTQEPGDLNTPKQITDSLKLVVTRNNVPADNFSYAEISAIIKKRPASNNLIVFRTDNGLFVNNTNTYSANVSSNDTTRAYIRYNKADLVRVTATVYSKDTREVYVTFVPAVPAQVLINPDSSILLPLLSSQTKITAKLIRLSGVVTERTIINYYDSTAITGASIGTFLNITRSDAQGTATVNYWLQDTSYHGFVYINGYVSTGAGRITGINRILIR
jgi:hypothetical protein